MATSGRLRRNSYEKFREQNDDEPGSTYVCACGQEYATEEHLRKHQQTSCKTPSVACSFCQDNFSSADQLRDHLVLCGNKTDQCPNCRKHIRRSHFAYHYENNCASVDEIETPPLRRRSPSSQPFPTNSNKPYAREDVPPPNEQSENYFGQHPSMYPQRQNGRIQSPGSNPRSSPGITVCEYCHQQCAANDYRTHRDNCLQNPANSNQKLSPSRVPLRSNQSENTSNGIVHIPCEICHQSIDIPNWAKHIQNCRERERQRLADRARSMSQEPVSEELPCEHCQQLFPPKRLQQHEIHCPKNPRNTVPSRKPPGQRPSTHVSLPTRSRDRRHNPAQQNDRSNINPRFAQYQSIDVDRTHQANRDQDQMPRSRSSEDVLHHEDSSGNFYTYDNQIRQQNGDRRYENASRSSNGRPQRTKSFDNLRSRDDGYDSSNRSAGNRPQHQDKRRKEDQRNLVIINNQSDRPFVKEKKPSFIKELFGCGTKSRNVID